MSVDMVGAGTVSAGSFGLPSKTKGSRALLRLDIGSCEGVILVVVKSKDGCP